MLTYLEEKKCWLLDGIVQRCNHPDFQHCQCYGRLHVGETLQEVHHV